MADLPANDYISQITRTQGEARTFFEQQRDFIAQLPGAQPASELNIVAGAITPDRAAHTVDTQGNAATDNLDRANLTNLPEGSQLTLKAANSARTVVIRHAQGGDGQFLLLNGQSIRLTDTEQEVVFNRINNAWVQKQVSRLLLPTSFRYTGSTFSIQLELAQDYTISAHPDGRVGDRQTLTLSCSWGSNTYNISLLHLESGGSDSSPFGAQMVHLPSNQSTTGILTIGSNNNRASWTGIILPTTIHS